MYLPSAFAAGDDAAMVALIRDYPLGMIITACADGLQVNALPFLPISRPDGEIRLQAHMARANPHFQALAEGTETLVVFQGPNAYISPNYYPSKQEHGRAVPTWNYAMVEARGELSTIQDKDWLRNHVAALSDWQEQQVAGNTGTSANGKEHEPWTIDDAPEAYMGSQLSAIAGIELRKVRLTGKFKLSQNKSAADRNGVINGLKKLDALPACTAALMDKLEDGN